MHRRTPFLVVGLLAAAASSGCIIHKSHGGPVASPPPPPPAYAHVHTEYCTVYTEMYDCSHADIVWLEQNGCLWDDMGVLLYLWWGCGRRYAIHDIHRWHYHERASWHICFSRARVDMYGMFVHVDYDPGGPYGRAYGYYRRRDPVERYELRDEDIRAVYRVNVTVNYYRRPPQEAFEHGRSRDDFHTFVRNEHSRQGRPHWDQTPQGRRENENDNRGRGPGATPAPGQGGNNRDGGQDPGRGPGTAPAQGQGGNKHDAQSSQGTPPGQKPPKTGPPDDKSSGQKPPESKPPQGNASGQKPPQGKPPDKIQPDNRHPDKSPDKDDKKGQGNSNKDKDKDPDQEQGQGQGQGGGKKK
jgi:hypothetical protein